MTLCVGKTGSCKRCEGGEMTKGTGRGVALKCLARKSERMGLSANLTASEDVECAFFRKRETKYRNPKRTRLDWTRRSSDVLVLLVMRQTKALCRVYHELCIQQTKRLSSGIM